MVSALAKDDYEDLIKEGLSPTLEDFDRLNQIALRLTDGAETTAANFPRVGWAGDVPFFQPTCSAISWYLTFVDRADFANETKDACWFYALAHARGEDAFVALLTPAAIKLAVEAWMSSLPITRGEMLRACRYATVGFDEAEVGKTDKQREDEEKKSEAEQREEALARISTKVAEVAAVTGIPPKELERETVSRLNAMVDAVRANDPMRGGAAIVRDLPRLRADYDLTLREIRRRLVAERDAKENESK